MGQRFVIPEIVQDKAHFVNMCRTYGGKLSEEAGVPVCTVRRENVFDDLVNLAERLQGKYGVKLRKGDVVLTFVKYSPENYSISKESLPSRPVLDALKIICDSYGEGEISNDTLICHLTDPEGLEELLKAVKAVRPPMNVIIE